jgi:hypothetical protein
MPITPQTLMELGQLAVKLAANPNTRMPFLRQVKKVDPNYRPPADFQLEEFKQQTRQEREQEKLAAQTAKVNEKLEAQRKKLVDSGKYTEDQIKEIETKVMTKYGLSDYDAGAKLYSADFAPKRPDDRPRAGRIWEFPDLPGLFENTEKAANDAAYAVIDELRAGR